MRKLAPMFIMTSVVALAGGTAFAGTNDTAMTTDKTGSPTVSKNDKNPQGNSYSDKSNTAKGTNSKMDDPAKQGSVSSSTSANVAAIDNDDKARTSNDPLNTKDTAQNSTTPKAKKHKSKIASNTATKSSVNPPVSSTNGAATNSTTGMSGGDGGSSGSGSAGAGAGAGSSK